jgi:hypothetical protein
MLLCQEISFTYYPTEMFDAYSTEHAIYVTSFAEKFLCLRKLSSQFKSVLLLPRVRQAFKLTPQVCQFVMRL